jgi:hypothetical protein
MTDRCCRHCVYAGPLVCGGKEYLVCANRADRPGDLTVVEECARCRSFRARRGPVIRVEPPEPHSDKLKHITLTKGKYAIVDAADFEELNKYKWHALEVAGGYYAARHEKGKIILMHRQIMQPPPGMVVDHVDGNRANNSRENLRICTQRQNLCNRAPHSKSGFKGVTPHRDKWDAKLGFKGKTYRAGVFADPVEAARARDRLAIQVVGEYAWLNRPEEAAVRIRNLAGTAEARSCVVPAALQVRSKDGTWIDDG